MKAPLSWLRDYVKISAPASDIAARMTLAGVEVGAVHEIGQDWANVFVARIEAIEPHPNADRLTLVTCDYGRERIRVVTGATNIAVGDIVPLAIIGARLYSPKSGKVETLKRGKIRGVESEGMVCAEDELGLSDDHEGIIILPPDAAVGAPIRDVLGDTVLDFEVTPNRADCLSLIGLAREIAALTDADITPPTITYPEIGAAAASQVRVDIEDPDLCPRYSALVIRDVKIGPSPKWVQDRLARAGVRPINNVVDITNYVMLEIGQPLHAFDLDKVVNGHIIVRSARSGERLTTLDGQLRELDPDILIIADPSGPIALAGVMGGLDSEVTDATTNILLESANFNMQSIRRARARFRLPSEASRRFERGLSAEQTLDAARRAAQLMAELAGGAVAPGAVDPYPKPSTPVEIQLPANEIQRLLGVPFDRERARSILTALGCQVADSPNGLVVTPPYWRLDLQESADLVEEYARIAGYDDIPAADIAGPIPAPDPTPERHWERVAKQTLVGCGYSEIITYSLTSEARLRRLIPTRLLASTQSAPGSEAVAASTPNLPAVMDYRLLAANVRPLQVLNPLVDDMVQLRISTMGSMLETLAHNLRHSPRGVQLFELGRIYLPRPNDLPDERRVLTIASSATQAGRHFGETTPIDFFDLKGIVEEVLDRIGVVNRAWEAVRHVSFDAGRAAAIAIGAAAPTATALARRGEADLTSDVVGVVGEVAREVREQFEIDQTAWLAYLDFDALLQHARDARRFAAIPRFPATLQDVSIIVDESLTVQAIERAVAGAGGRLLRQTELIDLYRGPQIGSGRKSLTFRLAYQADDRTLTDAEVQRVHTNIVRALTRDLGAEHRG